METAASIAVAVVALLHVWFMVLEMVLWTKPLGRRTFGLSLEFAQQSAALAANQGLYNGFLAAGLGWGLLTNRPAVVTFFLICAVVAGIFGAATANGRILLAQALPAAVALALTLLAWG